MWLRHLPSASRDKRGTDDRRDAAGRRCLDVAAAGIGIALLWPLLLALAALVRLTSPGPILFRSLRVGKNARPFVLLKFRTMVADAASLGPVITTAKDPRVTRVGAVLRKLKLDELPQLLNVLAGDMSLVGPRPEDPKYVALYDREQLAILDAKPGITSPASIYYRDEASQLSEQNPDDLYLSKIMPEKLAIDQAYLDQRTLRSDVLTVLRTVWTLARR